MTTNLFKPLSTKALLMGAVAIALVGVAAGAAYAAPAAGVSQGTPKSWNYEIKDGKRVPKAHRVTNADGSWREETRQGTCTTVKESSSAGEVKISRSCD